MIKGDIDIDVADRDAALAVFKHIPASIIRDNNIVKHNTGVYFHNVPVDPVSGFCSISYDKAHESDCFKIDVLNVGVYKDVKSEDHLLDLMYRNFDWTLMENQKFTSQLVHLNNHSEMVSKLKPTNIMELAMVLALIRPGKRRLVDKCRKYGFNSIANEIWSPPTDGSYWYKASHAVSYAYLVVVNANLLIEKGFQFEDTKSSFFT